MVKYIFSINPGRAGSHYLSVLFNFAEGCISFHEPKPSMNKKAMQEFNEGDQRKIRKLMKDKIKRIEKFRKDKVYVETNHCFIKGFGWIIPEYIDQRDIGVIILKRDYHEITKSLIRIRCIPLTKFGNEWLLSPYASQNVTTAPDNLVEYELTRWYVEEIYARAKKYMMKFPYINYAEVNLKELNDLDNVKKLFLKFNLVASSELESVIGRPTNIKI